MLKQNEGVKNLRAKVKGKITANTTFKFKDNIKIVNNPCGKLKSRKEILTVNALKVGVIRKQGTNLRQRNKQYSRCCSKD